MSNEVYGYEVTTSDDGQTVSVMLEGGQEIILSQAAYRSVLAASTDAESFKTNVIAAKDAAHAEWQAERGPDSELAQNMEAGNPQATHEH